MSNYRPTGDVMGRLDAVPGTIFLIIVTIAVIAFVAALYLTYFGVIDPGWLIELRQALIG